ncbi:MAG: hypothetical protein WBO57_08020 [Gammaproteobacteria bacterium]
MKANTLAFLSLACICSPAYAGTIDLSCEDLANQMIGRLANEGLLDQSAESYQRARKISLELCADAEEMAEQQHEADKQDTLKNWITQPTGGKPGNERLKRLKR